MREIKFRAWDKQAKEMLTWLEHSDWIKDAIPHCHGDEWTERCIVEQYTGLKDKNGKEIYEGDKVEMEYKLNNEKSIGIVKMIDGCWSLDFTYLPEHKRPYDPYNKILRRQDYLKMFTMSHQKTALIVGNRHENPELLEE